MTQLNRAELLVEPGRIVDRRRSEKPAAAVERGVMNDPLARRLAIALR